MLLLSYDWSESLKSYTNVILTLSTTKAEYLVVNTCGRYFSLTKFELIKLLDKLTATETEVSTVLYYYFLFRLCPVKLDIDGLIISIRTLVFGLNGQKKRDVIGHTLINTESQWRAFAFV